MPYVSLTGVFDQYLSHNPQNIEFHISHVCLRDAILKDFGDLNLRHLCFSTLTQTIPTDDSDIVHSSITFPDHFDELSCLCLHFCVVFHHLLKPICGKGAEYIYMLLRFPSLLLEIDSCLSPPFVYNDNVENIR